MPSVPKKVVIIGAGAAGLCTARYASAAGHEVTVYEQTSEIGGTWVYTDRIGTDEYGLKIHTSMYRDLLTNLPKEIMGFWNFEMPQDSSRSYISSDSVLMHLNNLASTFDLKKLIKFSHHVIRIRPMENSRWEVIVKDLPNDCIETHIYDAVFVCNGHYNDPIMPNLQGMDKFAGVQEHSHDYRNADNYKGKNVLIIGTGPSGIGLMTAISKTAKSIVLSSRVVNETMILPDNVTAKEMVKKITETGAIFPDGSEQDFTNIIYCTGYKYSFPFLSADCGLHVSENFVYPLYRHCINITHPTMYFIGLPSNIPVFFLLDIQARYCAKFLNNEKPLPSISEMLCDTDNFIKWRQCNNVPKRRWFTLTYPTYREYFEQLSKEADIGIFPVVTDRILEDSVINQRKDPMNYQKHVYTILDEQNFEKKLPTKLN